MDFAESWGLVGAPLALHGSCLFPFPGLWAYSALLGVPAAVILVSGAENLVAGRAPLRWIHIQISADSQTAGVCKKKLLALAHKGKIGSPLTPEGGSPLTPGIGQNPCKTIFKRV